MPASRSARAITLAPRSWPSSPGLATSTRIGGFIYCPVRVQVTQASWPVLLDMRRLLIRAKHPAECVADLAQRRVSTHRIQNERHGVLRALGRPPQRVQRLPYASIIDLKSTRLNSS